MRAAVVIGIDRPDIGGFTPLQSAASGAREIAGWLEEEGFDVTCLTDMDDRVTVRDVTKAMRRYVTVPTSRELLLLYFAGHGIQVGRSDKWLLSAEDGDLNEAIDVAGSIDIAYSCGIPTVVVVSDACRSNPSSTVLNQVQGAIAFPMPDPPSNRPTKVDSFRAALVGTEAFEVPVDGEVRTVLGAAWRSAYAEPWDDMILEVPHGTGTVRVVPNRRLEDYLHDKVGRLLDAVDEDLDQRILALVPSDDDVYVARARPPGPAAAPTRRTGSGPPIDACQDAADEDGVGGWLGDGDGDGGWLGDGDGGWLGDGDGPRRSGSRPSRVRTRTVAAAGRRHLSLARDLPSDEVAARYPGEGPAHYESGVGFAVRGAVVADVVATGPSAPATCELLTPGSATDPADPALVQLWDVERSASTVIVFADGRTCVLPALSGYISHVLVNDDGVANVSWVPSDTTGRWAGYAADRDRVDALRARVAVSIDRDVLAIGPRPDGVGLDPILRAGDAIDPTLALYAAHDYALAGRDDLVTQVADEMGADLGVHLFEARLLGGRRPDFDSAVTPFCPLLSASWPRLRTRGVRLPDVVAEVAPLLTPALWTTLFPGRQVDALVAATRAGEPLVADTGPIVSSA